MVDLEKIKIKGFIPSSLIEWSGNISAIIFLQGCNMRCPFCHGWRFLKNNDDLDNINLNLILKEMREKRGWVDSIVISGGEPTLLGNKLIDLIDEFRKIGLKVKLHSNGSSPKTIEKLINQNKIHCIALDYKSILSNNKYQKACGVNINIERIKDSFNIVGKSNIEVEFHTTLCPSIIELKDLYEMGRYLKNTAPLSKWYLQQYNKDDVLDIKEAGEKIYTTKEIDEVVCDIKNKEIWSNFSLLY